MNMAALDRTITHGLNSFAGASAPLDLLMIAVSKFGVPILIAILLIGWLRSRSVPAARHAIVASGLTFLLGLALNQAILLFVERVRPYDAGVTQAFLAHSADPSFPSDHTTASFAIAFAFLLNGRRDQAAWLLAAAILIALSRVYLGMHYAGDVLGGVMTAAFAALMVQALYPEGTRIDRWLTGIF
jgi:undecaprenyl-diphosphatase